jgi:hypothetical protein
VAWSDHESLHNNELKCHFFFCNIGYWVLVHVSYARDYDCTVLVVGRLYLIDKFLLIYRRGIHNIDQNVRIRAIRVRVAETYTSFLSSIESEFLKAQMRLLTIAQWKKYLVEICSEHLSLYVDHFVGAEEYCSSIQELDWLMEYHSYDLKTRRKLDVTAHRAISV